MGKIKTTFIATVLNEEKTIVALLDSIAHQTQKIDEVIIVDGGSTDNTLSVISNFKFPISNKFSKIKILQKKGNRAVGRNFAIEKAKNQIILCSDAGCILDKNWVKEITKPFNQSAEVVAGYYKGTFKSLFEKAMIPYTLVMPDNVDPNNFLPASRSMAFTKQIWQKAGRFEEKYSYNEDYVFAHALREINAKMVFAKKAVVLWQPRSSYKEAAKMFYRFAYGDAQAGIIRPKVILLFARYIVGIVLAYYFFYIASVLFVAYCIWALLKNYKYVQHPSAFYTLPILQILSDIFVMAGSIMGLVRLAYGV